MQEIDGHDTDAIRDAITAARAVTDKPSMIACKTIIGFGFPTKAGTQKAHSDAPGEEEIAGARKILGWDSPPFVIPEHLLREWREIGAKGRAARMAWADRVKAAPAELRSEFERRNDGKLPADWKKAIAAARAEFIASGKEMATRSASGAVLDHLAAAIPELLGGSADLTPSTELPAEMNAFKVQQTRWAKGLMQTAIKILPRVLRSDAPYTKVEAFFHLSANICYPLVILLSLLALPVMTVRFHLGGFIRSIVDLFVFIATTGSISGFLPSFSSARYPRA